MRDPIGTFDSLMALYTLTLQPDVACRCQPHGEGELVSWGLHHEDLNSGS
jgi:hypothetical protein